MTPAQNGYDWLGTGYYFWEADPARAMRWAIDAQERHEREKNVRRAPDKIVRDPYVFGAVISYGACLDLTSFQGVEIVKGGYHSLLKKLQETGDPIPENKGGVELKGRYLDCAVINHTCSEYLRKRHKDFDTVRAVFLEGDVLYGNAGFREKTHTQLCVRQPDVILGFFRLHHQPEIDGL